MRMIFLDLEKAFDRVFQNGLINLIRKINTFEKTINPLETLYENLRFRITNRRGKSDGADKEEEYGKVALYHNTFS